MASGKHRGPRLPNVAYRYRLFDRFKELLTDSQALWIAGLPGAGKTTAIATYIAAYRLRTAWLQVDAGDSDPATFFNSLNASLEPVQHKSRSQPFTAEYFNAVKEFTSVYFESLALRVELPLLIVLDNYQEMAELSPLHVALAELIPRLPEGISLVFVSRGAPPSPFARAVINRELAVVDERQLRLAGEEALAIAKLQLRGITPKMAADIESWCARVDGWVSGLILLLEQRKDTIQTFAFDAANTQVLFNYFAKEIFEKTDDVARHVLLCIAVLPFTSSSLACALSGSARAGEFLEILHSKNFFVSYRAESDTYQCHTLFQSFLQARLAASSSREDLIALRCQAAELLERFGYLEEALALYREVGHTTATVRLILRLAPGVAARGRLKDLREWIGGLPPDLRNRTAWLRYWQGVCGVPFVGDESCEHFEAAFTTFDAAEATGRVLACIGAIDSIVLMWRYFEKLNVWIERIDAMSQATLTALSEPIFLRCAASMSCALILRQPGRPNLVEWLERARRAPTTPEDQWPQSMSLSIAVTLHGVMGHIDSLAGSGRFAAAIRHEPGGDPLAQIAGKYVQSAREFVHGRVEAAMTHAEQGLEIIEHAGAHIWYPLMIPACMYFALTAGNRKAIDSYRRRLDAFFNKYPSSQRGVQLYCEAWCALFHGDTKAAIAAASKAAESAARGTPYTELHCRYVLAQAHIDAGVLDAARFEIQAGQELARVTNAPVMEYAFELIAAELAFLSGDTQAADAVLSRALGRARDAGFMCFLGWLPARMTRIFAYALQQGIEVRFVQERIRGMRTAFAIPPAHVEAWPWPVKIRTLGQFTVLLDEELMQFESKVPKRSLEFLAALAGHTDEASEVWLKKALWKDPDDDDDDDDERKAAASLTTAVNRLRQLVGDDAIRRQGGFVGLNPDVCWTDVGALTHFMEMLGSAGREGNGQSALQALAQLRKLYRAGFLAGTTDAPWALDIRNKLERKLRRHLRIAGQRLQQRRQSDAARECVELERDLPEGSD